MEIRRCLYSVSRATRTARSVASHRRPSYVHIGRRCLHCSQVQHATPGSFPSTAGPPPQPPQVAVDQPDAIGARKRKQIELLERGRALKVDPSKPGTALQKRFWKNVSVKSGDDGLQIFLDTRPVRTASKQILTVPASKRALATAIALEWDNLVSAQQALKQHYIPLTSIVSRAVDVQDADAEGNLKPREEIIRMMMRYLSTDTLLCWAPEKNVHDIAGMMGTSTVDHSHQSLRSRQIEVAEPIIAYLKSHVFPGVDIDPILDEDSIMPKEQSEVTRQIISGWLNGLPAFELAALERGVLATKSLLIAIRLLVDWSPEFKHLHGAGTKFGIEQAAEASTVEVKWQTDMWGEVEDTHDVEKEDLARQLGSAILLVS